MLTSIAAKIYSALLHNHIEPKIEKILRKNQNSFQRNQSTTSQILTIHRILEGICAKNLEATILFVDFSKAFDSIHRRKMEQIPLTYSLPKQTVAAIRMLYKKHKSKSLISGWRHRLLWYRSKCTARRHVSPLPLYHLSRQHASNIYW